MLKCGQCHRAGDELIEGNAPCGSFHVCPRTFKEVNPETDVVLACDACGKTVSLTAGQVLHGQTQEVFRCGRDMVSCEALVVNLYSPTPRAKPSKGKAKAV